MEVSEFGTRAFNLSREIFACDRRDEALLRLLADKAWSCWIVFCTSPSDILLYVMDSCYWKVGRDGVGEGDGCAKGR